MGKKPCNPGPRNLRSAENYSIGIDLGTGSVGWCVTDEDGELYRINGNKPTWGARLFPSADTAASTRLKRGQRRRYDRRRQRIEELQKIFCEEMQKVDPEFFIRMRQSRLAKDDRSSEFDAEYEHPFFNGSDFTESEYYKRFPTIWHLRKWLMETAETGEKADLRLVYLALHNIVKYRGNFLHEDEGSKLTAANADAHVAAQSLADELIAYRDALAEDSDDGGEDYPEWKCEPDVPAIKDALDNPGLSRAERADRLQAALGIVGNKTMPKNLAKACVGYEVEFLGEKGIFACESADVKSKFSLADEEKVDAFLDGACPEEALSLFEALQRAYSAYVLAGLLGGSPSISASMVASYNQHKSDLETVKGLTRGYLGEKAYRSFFRGPKVHNPLDPDDKTRQYDYNKLVEGTYTAYVVRGPKSSDTSQEELVKNIRKMFEASPELLEDKRYLGIKDRLEAGDGKFLAKQKTRENGAIPYQLHLEELVKIVEAQGHHYPFLFEAKPLLEKIVSSRIPYYVGPLNTQHDPKGNYPNRVDGTRKFGWSVRREGMEGVEVHPWNVEEVIDTDATAERFIERMLGTCTYLYGETVLPRCSLLYEEFCVLNELNGVRWASGNNELHRFDSADRRALVEEVFKQRKGVSHRAIAEWIKKRHGFQDVRIVGTQKEDAFESKLSSYNDFCNLFGVTSLEEAPLSAEEIEQVILWSTVFEDRDIVRRKLVQAFGDRLGEKVIERLVRKRYTGWGRLSRKFLTGLRAETSLGQMSMMDVLRDGDPYPGRHLRALNLMEALRDKDLGFQELVDRANEAYLEEHDMRLSVDDLQGSPALRRSINQAMRIIDEIVSIAGKPPARICIEETRDDDEKKRGKRTNSRYKSLKVAVDTFREESAEFDEELSKQLEARKDDLDDDRLLLYFRQAGKSLYSGKRLEISRLNEYQIDHILPQSYIKDDSLDNRALVLQSENQRKLDSLLLDYDTVIKPMRSWWEQLKSAGMISEKMFANLTRTSISDGQLRGFINRQLVETGQIVKFVRQMCEQRYPGTDIVTVRASLSHGLRENCGLVKCREINDYHHAHDAYLACQMARFIEYRYPSWRDGLDLAMVRKYVKRQAEEFGTGRGQLPGRSGFIVDSFMRSGFDKETGEVFKDGWDFEKTIARIRRDLDSKYCFISRMPEEMSGGFWDETIYSPRDSKDGKNLSMPLKQASDEGYLDPKRYGGPNNVKQAYFFIFAAKDKKGRDKFFFEGVPIHLAQRIKADGNGNALREYAEGIANGSGCSGAKILRDKVLYRQKLELDSCAFYLGGKTNGSNWITPAAQVCVSQDALNLYMGKSFSSDGFTKLYTEYAEKLALTCPKLAKTLGLSDLSDRFARLNEMDVRALICHLFKLSSGSEQKVNLQSLGGKANVGAMSVSIVSNVSRIIWIDQSVTGMFERRTTFEDLTHGL